MNNSNPYPSPPSPQANPGQPITPFSATDTNPSSSSNSPSSSAILSSPSFTSSPVASGQSFTPAASFPNQTQIPTPPVSQKRFNNSLIATITLIVVSLIAITFIGLFIYAFIQWNSAKQDVDGQVKKAVDAAVYSRTVELENQFAEKEKYPFKTFAGPVDLGEVTFEYPRTWSVYVARESGGEFQSVFNPDLVHPVNNETINSLRFVIKSQDFNGVARSFESNIRSKKLSLSVRPVGGQNANIYKGELPGSRFNGIAALFKLRDKTVLIQTDAMIFEKDFHRILDSVRYNQ